MPPIADDGHLHMLEIFAGPVWDQCHPIAIFCMSCLCANMTKAPILEFELFPGEAIIASGCQLYGLKADTIDVNTPVAPMSIGNSNLDNVCLIQGGDAFPHEHLAGHRVPDMPSNGASLSWFELNPFNHDYTHA